MRHTWIRTIIAAIFLMTQVAGAAVLRPSCVQEKEVSTCKLACCASTVCECGMAPSQTPVKPAPLVPVPHTQDIKFMPVLLSVLVPPFAQVVSQEQPMLLAPETFLPHCPPALALHCALLI